MDSSSDSSIVEERAGGEHGGPAPIRGSVDAQSYLGNGDEAHAGAEGRALARLGKVYAKIIMRPWCDDVPDGNKDFECVVNESDFSGLQEDD
eukprot:828721-Karenia_brevis.AAC.1